jgi:acetoin utilization deacetylase AcuC-like enzyme
MHTDQAVEPVRHAGGAVARPELFYRQEYVCDVLEAGRRQTFDVLRPQRIRDALAASGLIDPAAFVAPALPAEADLRLVHPAAYLERIRVPATLARLLFLDPSHPWDDRLLLPFLYATGGTLAAALGAAASGGIGLNLGGGFHHAQADKAEGFCAVADVAIAIRRMQCERSVERVLIVDLDYHHGNGNAAIFATDESVFTFSMHAANWCWLTKRHNLDIELPAHTGDAVYLRTLQGALPPILAEFQPDFVFYVAGSDPFVEDRLGDFDVSEPGMLARDRFVTEQVRGRDLPLVVVTAGGYGPSSWRIHCNYYRWLLEVAAGP